MNTEGSVTIKTENYALLCYHRKKIYLIIIMSSLLHFTILTNVTKQNIFIVLTKVRFTHIGLYELFVLNLIIFKLIHLYDILFMSVVCMYFMLWKYNVSIQSQKAILHL